MKTKLLSNGLMLVDGDKWLSKWIEEQGTICTDDAVTRHILPRLRIGDWVIDAGASLGDHTIPYAQKTVSGPVFAFEPQPLSYECLVHNAKPYGNIRPINLALSDAPSHFKIIENENVGAAHLADDSDGVVQSVTLDTFCSGILFLDYMKIDVEGMELKLLKGADATLKKFKPLLFVELNRGALARNQTTPEDVIGHLGELGYRPEWLSPKDGPHLEQVDCFFVHNDNPR